MAELRMKTLDILIVDEIIRATRNINNRQKCNACTHFGEQYLKISDIRYQQYLKNIALVVLDIHSRERSVFTQRVG